MQLYTSDRVFLYTQTCTYTVQSTHPGAERLNPLPTNDAHAYASWSLNKLKLIGICTGDLILGVIL